MGSSRESMISELNRIQGGLDTVEKRIVEALKLCDSSCRYEVVDVVMLEKALFILDDAVGEPLEYRHTTLKRTPFGRKRATAANVVKSNSRLRVFPNSQRYDPDWKERKRQAEREEWDWY